MNKEELFNLNLMMKQYLVDLKTSVKKDIDKVLFFPGMRDHLSSLELNKMKPILTSSHFKPQFKSLEEVNVSLDEMFSLNFSLENEYISKQYSTYLQKPFYKFIFLSNLYKVFIVNIPQLPHFTSFDFFSLIILLCPDFPKVLAKKLTMLSVHFNNKNFTPEGFAENIELSNKVNLHEFFCLFCIYFLYSDFFGEVDKLYSVTPNVSIKELKKLRFIRVEYLYEIIISSNEGMKDEYYNNSINTLEEAEDIIDKREEIKINYGVFCEKSLKNYNMINEIFKVDDKGYEFLYVLNTLNYAD